MELAPLASVDVSALRWLRTSEAPSGFELSSGDRPVARLTFRRPSGTLASLSTSTGELTFKRLGFLHPIVTARAANSDRDLARVTVHLNYHRIEVSGGSAYRLHRAGLLVPAWKVSTDAGVELLHIEPVREGRTLAGGAVIGSGAGAKDPNLALLAGLAWYVIVLVWFEDEALVPLEGPDAPAPPSSTSR